MPRFTHPSARTIAVRAITLGFATGLRSTTSLGALALRAGSTPGRASWSTWPLWRSSGARTAVLLGMAGEMVMDKLPILPSRLEPQVLMGRIAFGSLAGWAVSTEGRGSGALLAGILGGALGAIAGSYGGYHARQAIGRMYGLPDPVVAVGEDVIALSLATTAASA